MNHAPVIGLLIGLLLPVPSLSRGADTGPRPRARDLKIPFEGQPGPLNAITDVAGVEVGHQTIIRGSGRLRVGEGPVRTGVTAIFPTGRAAVQQVPAGVAILNGNGEVSGAHWVKESGLLETPILLTNTHSLGTVRDAVIAWGQLHYPKRVEEELFSLPVVAEIDDSSLSDMNGFHIQKQHVFAAMDGARSGPVAEGNVGGGTGAVLCDFKGGIGTASRVVTSLGHRYVVGALVQANFGVRSELRIAGVPVGQEIVDLQPVVNPEQPSSASKHLRTKDGSIIVVLAFDAPLLPHQLERLARRASLGMGRLGAISYDSSGDMFLAFSTSIPKPDDAGVLRWAGLPNEGLDALFQGTVEATEEAIVNALIGAETMTGINGNTVHALPHARLQAVLKKYGRIAK